MPTTPSSPKMGLSLHGDKVLVPTSDLHVLALNARSGELVWDHKIAADNPAQGRTQYQLRSAPLVVGDKVIQGVTASFSPRGGFILAHRHQFREGALALQHHRPAGRAGREQLERLAAGPAQRRLGLATGHL